MSTTRTTAALGSLSVDSGLAMTADLPSPTLSARQSEAALRVSQAALQKQLTDERQRYHLEESDKDDLWNLGSVTRSRTIPELD